MAVTEEVVAKPFPFPSRKHDMNEVFESEASLKVRPKTYDGDKKVANTLCLK